MEMMSVLGRSCQFVCVQGHRVCVQGHQIDHVSLYVCKVIVCTGSSDRSCLCVCKVIMCVCVYRVIRQVKTIMSVCVCTRLSVYVCIGSSDR